MARKPIPDSAAMPVSVGAWLDEMAALGRKSDEGLSTHELAAALGVSLDVVRMRLRQLATLGRLVVGTRTGSRIDGRGTQVPVYRVRPAAEGKTRP